MAALTEITKIKKNPNHLLNFLSFVSITTLVQRRNAICFIQNILPPLGLCCPGRSQQSSHPKHTLGCTDTILCPRQNDFGLQLIISRTTLLSNIKSANISVENLTFEAFLQIICNADIQEYHLYVYLLFACILSDGRMRRNRHFRKLTSPNYFKVSMLCNGNNHGLHAVLS